MYKISEIIQEKCKKYDIKYFSPYYQEKTQWKTDIQELADMYCKLKEKGSEILTIIEQLKEMIERYKDFPDIHKELFKDIVKLVKTVENIDKIDHHLIYEANKILRRKQNDNKIISK